MSDGFAFVEIIDDYINGTNDFIIHEANPAFENITGIDKATITGKPILASFPKIADVFFDWIKTIIDKASKEKIIRFYKFIPTIYKLIDFTIFSEQPGFYHILFHEMNYYRQEAGVVKNMVDGIVYYQQIYNEEGNNINFKILNVNPAFEKVMGMERKDVVGKLLTNIFPDTFNHINMIIDANYDVVTRGEPKTYEFYSQRLNRWLSVTLFCPNKGFGAAVFSDISKFKIQESTLKQSKKKAEAANNAKSELLTTISHELRTPLNVILSATQLLSLYLGEDKLYKKENAAKHIKTMRQNCLRLIRLVNNIIDSNKIESGLFRLDMKNYDLVNMARKIVDSTEEYAHIKGNKVHFRAHIDELVMAFDLNAMERIMLNLLSNAFKFTKDKGDINVSIDIDGGYMVMSVKDQGIGIPEDKRELIFERFKQVNNLIARENEGSGLGLAITRTLVQMHDGTISVRSNEEEGSEFIIRIPVRTVKEENSTGESSILSDRLIERINIEFSDIYL